MGSAVVAFTDPQGVFSRNERLVEQHLKQLTNLHWRPSDDSAIRTVPHLQLQLVPEQTTTKQQHQIPGLNNTPLVQILVVETAPLEIYRSKLRQIGKDWFRNQVDVRDPTGYVVVHSLQDSENTKNAKAIWSRLNAEFDGANCIQLFIGSGTDANQWAQLRQLVQSQLVTAFGARVSMLENEIRKLSATRDIPGWNFGIMFALHESLAWAYESMNLIDDALHVYKNLEQMIEQIPLEKWAATPLTSGLCFGGARDALIDAMLTQTAAFFDVQRHLLSRSVHLLLGMAQIKRLGAEMVDSLADQYVLECVRLALARTPVLVKLLVAKYGEKSAYLWLLKAARELLMLVTEVGSPKLSQGKGEIILIERDAIQKLGTARNWSIPGIFNDISLHLTTNADDGAEYDEGEDGDGVFNLEDENAYRKEFVKLTQQAIGYYRSANLPRAVTRLTFQIVLIEFYSGNVENAWEVMMKTPSLFRLNVNEPATTILDLAMSAAEQLGHTDKLNTFAWQILSLDLESVPLALFEKAVTKAEQLATTTNSVGTEMVIHNLNSWFEVDLVPYIAGDENGYYLELELLPKRHGYPFLPLNSASIVSANENVVFSAPSVPLGVGTGIGKIKLYTASFYEGVLNLSHLEMFHAYHKFVYDLNDVYIAMVPLTTAFTTHVTLGKHYTMRKRWLELHISSPKPVGRANIQIISAHDELQVLWEEAVGTDCLTDFTTAVVNVPVLVSHEHSKSRVKVRIDYDDNKVYEFTDLLDFSLTVSVDFQEYFRQPPCILSQFFVKPFSSIPTMFSNAELHGSKLYAVNFAGSDCQEEYIAYNNAPVSYVFGIEKCREVNNSMPEFMELKLVYRSAMWEFQYTVFEATKVKLREQQLGCYSLMVKRIVNSLSMNFNVLQYLKNDLFQLDDPHLISHAINSTFQYMHPQHVKTVTDILLPLLQRGVAKPPQSNDHYAQLNSTMMLEVPDPDAGVVHYVELSLQTSDGKPVMETEKIMVGCVLNAHLKINTVSFKDDEDIIGSKFEYELDRLSDGWSYTGRVKGLFEGSAEVSEQFQLVPNRSGVLLVPNVVIRPVQPAARPDTNSEHSVAIFEPEETVVVANHANTRLLVVPEVNMLAITF